MKVLAVIPEDQSVVILKSPKSQIFQNKTLQKGDLNESYGSSKKCIFKLFSQTPHHGHPQLRLLCFLWLLHQITTQMGPLSPGDQNPKSGSLHWNPSISLWSLHGRMVPCLFQLLMAASLLLSVATSPVFAFWSRWPLLFSGQIFLCLPPIRVCMFAFLGSILILQDNVILEALT